jgi:hypothetical protein
MVGLHLHSPLLLRGMVLNYLNNDEFTLISEADVIEQRYFSLITYPAVTAKIGKITSLHHVFPFTWTSFTMREKLPEICRLAECVVEIIAWKSRHIWK